MTGGRWNERVKFEDLRAGLRDIGRAEQDKALIRMQAEGRLVLYRNNDPMDMTGADHEAALDLMGEKRHLVYMKGGDQ